jgi:hypothetical protein
MRRAASLYALFIAAGVAVAVAGGISIMDSPQTARFKRLDDKRLRDLQSLSQAINAYRAKTHKLPESLAQLAQDQGLARLNLQDDENEPYDYRVKDEAAYELCARFKTASDGRVNYYGALGEAKHPAGYYCFSFTTAR